MSGGWRLGRLTTLTVVATTLALYAFAAPTAYGRSTHAIRLKEIQKCQPNSVPKEQRCAFVRTNAACRPEDGWIPYLEVHYCYLDQQEAASTAVFLLWIAVLFSLMLVVAERFFCPSLELIAEHLHLPPCVAGATLLSFGNGAPDVFTQLAAISQGDDSEAASPDAIAMALSEPLGSGLFVGNIVFALVVFFSGLSEVPVQRSYFLKDCLFYLGGVTGVFALLLHGEVQVWQVALLAAYYMAFIVATILLSRGDEPVHADPRLHEVPHRLRPTDSFMRESYHQVPSISEGGGDDLTTHLLSQHRKSNPGLERIDEDSLQPPEAERSGGAETGGGWPPAGLDPILDPDLDPELDPGEIRRQRLLAMTKEEPAPAILPQEGGADGASSNGTQHDGAPNGSANGNGTGHGSGEKSPTGAGASVATSPAAAGAAPATEHGGEGREAAVSSATGPGGSSSGSASACEPQCPGGGRVASWCSWSSTSGGGAAGGGAAAATAAGATASRCGGLPLTIAAGGAAGGGCGGGGGGGVSWFGGDSATLPGPIWSFGSGGSPGPGLGPGPGRAPASERSASLRRENSGRPPGAMQRAWRRVEKPGLVLLSVFMPRIAIDDHARYRKTCAVMLPPLLPTLVGWGQGWLGPAAAPGGFWRQPWWLAATGVGLAVAAAAAVYYPRKGHLHGYAAGVATVVVFCEAMFLLDASAGELVSAAVALGQIYGISPSLLGATLLAWGNSVSDLVSNITLAMDGLPTMAITACFASPMFVLLAGLVTSLSYATRHGNMPLPHDLALRVLYGSSITILAMWALVVPLMFRFRLNRRVGVLAVAVYLVYQGIYITAVIHDSRL